MKRYSTLLFSTKFSLAKEQDLENGKLRSRKMKSNESESSVKKLIEIHAMVTYL